MKFLARSLLTSLLACFALSELQAELPASPQRICSSVVFRSLHGAQLAIGILAQHSVIRILGDDSATWQIDDDLGPKKRHPHGKASADAIVTGESYKLQAGQSTDGALVLIGGNGSINGTVNGDLVLIGSRATLAGTVNGDFVTICSNLSIDPGAVANGDYVSVASQVKGEEELTANGDRLNLNTFSPGVPVVKEVLGNIVQLRAMSPSSIFSWALAIVTLTVCLVLGLSFPNLFAKTETIIRNRPGPSFLVGLAVVLGGALLSFLLAITIIGIIALPFLGLALFILHILGCTAVCYSIGRRIAPQFAEQQRYAACLWITLGTVVLWVLYCLPIIGFMAAGAVSLLGLGTFAIYLVDRDRSSSPRPQLTTSAPADSENPAILLSRPPHLPGVEPPMVIAESRAQFLPRLLANVIDLTVLYVLLNSLHLTHATIPVWVLYRFGMFAWRSSTLGQIVLQLRVQKPDGTSLIGDYSGALIRALSSLISLIPLGLGFIWILFNRDLEAWHDKISATYVVQLNRSASQSATPPSSAGPTPTPPPTI
jgi:uncharacterized RDD family membrane protein YckC